MAETNGQAQAASTGAPAGPAVHVGPSPHVVSRALTTRRMMLDVLMALAPVMVVAVSVFGVAAIVQVAYCVGGCLAAEAGFAALRRKPFSLTDCSAVVTGVILAMSLPAGASWYVGVIAAVAAVVLGKMVFGGLGQNMFNPAMVGRAFVMICFAGSMGAKAYQQPLPGDWDPQAGRAVPVVSQATPMTAYKQRARAPSDRPAPQEAPPSLGRLFLGNVNGSLGETSVLACLLGGLYLCIRRTASWEIPAGVLGAVAVIASLIQIMAAPAMGVLHHLFGGALMFGAFYIATDPVTSPLTPKGKFIFGLGVGAMVMLLRTLSNYPEGVMFAVLLMNAVTPLINRWTIPTPLGGPVPVPEKT